MSDIDRFIRVSLLYTIEDFGASSGKDAFVFTIASHRITFSRAGLSVGKQTHVVSFKGVVEDTDAQIIEDLVLIGVLGSRERLQKPTFYFFKAVVGPVNVVECVVFRFFVILKTMATNAEK